MPASFVDRFGAVAADYADFRPSYPPALFDWLASIAPAHSLAWDCATGSGQAAVALAAHFDRVIATDASAGQIACATPHPRVAYRVASADASGLHGASLDLITVAQALHWFDIDGFFAECDRVLAAGGVLAVWSYGPPEVDDDAVDAIVQHYFRDVVGPYWPPVRALVESGYAAIALPFPELAVPSFEMTALWSMDQLVGYLGTWSATSAYRQARGQDPRDRIAGPLAQAWADRGAARKVRWPLTVRVGRKASR